MPEGGAPGVGVDQAQASTTPLEDADRLDFAVTIHYDDQGRFSPEWMYADGVRLVMGHPMNPVQRQLMAEHGAEAAREAEDFVPVMRTAFPTVGLAGKCG